MSGPGHLAGERGRARPWSAAYQADVQAPFAHPYATYQVSCPTAAFCASVDSAGRALTSTDPAGPGAWSPTPITPAGSLMAISCPTDRFCVAGGASTIATSADPGGGSPWSVATLPDEVIERISCPTAGWLQLNWTARATLDRTGRLTVVAAARATGGAVVTRRLVIGAATRPGAN